MAAARAKARSGEARARCHRAPGPPQRPKPRRTTRRCRADTVTARRSRSSAGGRRAGSNRARSRAPRAAVFGGECARGASFKEFSGLCMLKIYFPMRKINEAKISAVFQNGKAWCVPCLVSLDTLQELCRKEKLTCKSIGITKRNLNNYEVEYLCDYKVVKGVEYYLVKWKGWPDSTNTWEPLWNLRCPQLLQQFSDDKNTYLSQGRKRKAITSKDNNKSLQPAVAEYIVQKARQRIALQRWQDYLNRRKNHKGMIFVENTVDLEGPPSDFYYINEYRPAPGITLNSEATFGCSCTNCFFEKCCPAEAGVVLAYNKNRQIKIQPGTPIYECNSRCRCGPDCPNRIVQKGTQYSLCIFRTSNGCGWGVKTLVKIKRMSFVMEYVGEVITSEEAERRGQLYDNKGITYLFDLDYESDEFTVDAARYGNVSHFVNHSCDPNLQVFSVFIDNLDTRLPRIALFSTRTIKAGEELTFDYQMKGSGELSSDSIDYSPARKRVRTQCKCGAETCRGYLN
ncbi:histone-lysine N-methyltransferase SUV39H2 isoform X1 [Rattus norvegicus]|uniref:Histone-lysine N-methyltransferase n=1 Tax=Rattus norvegicus TaxID=10116 RepID=A0ABK0LW82_RAT|nr:histone-lysine N-methyltransferase SUV39H2 isoform X1 [Rattus norvegicus]